MDYRVESLAAKADVSVDTIRFYQARGLLPGPRREGRVAWYGDDHLERLARIRRLQDRGLTLATIARLLAGGLDVLLQDVINDGDESMRLVARQAVETFDAHVRSQLGDSRLPNAEAAERLAEAFTALLPATTALMNHHFQQTLLDAARSHIERVSEHQGTARVR